MNRKFTFYPWIWRGYIGNWNYYY